VFICIGTYTVSNSTFDIWLVAFFGVVGYLMRIWNFPAAPVLLGFVLGPMMEENFRRAMLLSRGDFMIFIDRPISAAIMGVTAVLLLAAIISGIRSGARVRN